jgi:hypothetical protein
MILTDLPVGHIILLLIVAAIVICIYYSNVICKPEDDNKENFLGAMTQLYAKGPEDINLTVNTERYVPEFMYPFWSYWNMPTRVNRYGYYNDPYWARKRYYKHYALPYYYY